MNTKSKQNKTLLLILGVLLALAVAAGLFFGIKALTGGTRNQPTDTETGSNVAVPTGSADSSADPSGEPGSTGDTTPTGETQEETPEMKAAKTKAVYTEDGIASDDARFDEIVARCGDYSLTNRQAQIYYFMQYFNFMSQYGAYASMLGIDESKPLSEQASFVGDLSWEQYFLMAGVEQFQQYAAAATEAKAEGYSLNAQEQEQLETALDSMPEDAQQYGFESVDAYLQASFGPGVRFEDYKDYLSTYFLAMSYENYLYESIETDDATLQAYYEAHPEDFEDMGTDTPNVNVRHILISTEADEDGNVSDEAVAAARTKAEELLESFRRDPSEENFAALARDNTDDPGSKESGGLYEDVYPGQMVQPFNDWCFDAAREPGDTDIVQTSYGFHVMYFVAKTDSYQWKTVAQQNYRMELMDGKIEALVAAAPLEADYEKIVLGALSAAETTE